MKSIKLVISLLVVTVSLFFGGTVYASSGDYTVVNDVNNPKTVDQFKYEITVFDEEDGYLTQNIYVVLDNYTGNEGVLGDFIVIYGVIDSHGLEVTFAITVKNVDVRKPTIVFDENVLKVPQNTDLNYYDFDFTAVDGFEGNVTASLVVTGLELIDTTILGSNSITVTAEDSTGNIETLLLDVVVSDVTKPVLSIPHTIIKKDNYILRSDFFLDYVSASDDIDGNLTSFIVIEENNFQGNGNIPGSYEIVLSVTDTYGNKDTQSIRIVVDKKLAALLVVDYLIEKEIYLDVNQELGTVEFIDLMKHLGDLPDNDFIVDEILDTYTTHIGTKGEYLKVFNLVASNGTEYELALNVNVINANLDIVEDSDTVLETGWHLFQGWWILLAVIVVFVIGLFFKTPNKPKFRKY